MTEEAEYLWVDKPPAPVAAPLAPAPAVAAAGYDKLATLRSISEEDLRAISAMQFKNDPRLRAEFKTAEAYVAYRVAERAGTAPKPIKSGDGCYRAALPAR